jgi:lipopolysaccharide biosynthesis glycosyltransferase
MATDNNPVIIVSASNDRYCMGLAVALVSALQNCRGWAHEPVSIIVLDGGIRPRNWRRLEKSLHLVGVAHRVMRFRPDLSLFDGFPMDYGASYLTYARLLLPKLLPDTNRILYIDSDLLILESLVSIWNTKLENCAFAAVVDAHVKTVGGESLPVEELGLLSDAPYAQAGFMLLDLDTWREMNLSELCFDYLRRYPERAKHWDQSALNAIIDQKWAKLPDRWNVPAACVGNEPHKESTKHPAVVHFSGPYKPWNYGIHTWGVSQSFFSVLDQTAWRGWRPSRVRAILKLWKSRLSQILKIES